MGEDSQHLDRMVLQLMHEVPKISDAAKNLLSEQVARASVDTENKMEATELLAAIQLVLKALKTVELIDPMEWGRVNPQQETQSGMDRVDDIVRYKAAYALWRKVKASGQSPSKLLGRTFLVAVWPQVRTAAESTPTLNAEALTCILNAFESSLNPVRKELDVVWAVDLQATVTLRHMDRKQQVEQRTREQEEELKNMVIEQLN